MKIVNSELKHSGKFLEIYVDTAKTDSGKEVKWERCSRKNNTKAVMIVPYHVSEKKFVMISEYRIPIQGRELGFPAGLIDKENESVEDVIKRELKEETGLDLKEIITISPMVYSSSGMTDEAISIAYVLVDGKVSDKFLEGSEDIKSILVDKSDLTYFMGIPEIHWGAKAWTIVYSILNPNPFKIN